MKNIAHILLGLALVSLLAACGGSGGSSSGGGSSTTVAGSYSGTVRATVSGGGMSIPTVGSIDLMIHEDGTVISDPGTQFPGRGSVSGNRLALNVGANSFNEPGLSCRGSIRLEGTISGDRISGTVSGVAISCNGVPIGVSGSFNASRVAQARQAADRRSLFRIGDSLRHLMP